MDLNEKLAKSIYLIIQSLRQEDIARILRELEKSQWYSTEQLLEQQWRLFTGLIEYAYEKVPYYRRRFDEARIKPADIQSRDDLKEIPLLTKQDIRENFSNLQIPDGGAVEKLRTSGSTGEPLRIVRDRASTGYHRANMFRLRRWYGADIGSFEATFRIFNYPTRERHMTRVKDFILNRVRINEHELTTENMLDFYHKLESVKPAIFYGFPSIMVRFTECLIKHDINPRPIPLKAIITTSEMLYPQQEELLSEFYGAPVINEYGCTETGIISLECPHGGWHVPVESCLVEVAPATGLDVDDGVGRVVVTDLMNRAMPLIRYDVGDLMQEGLGRCPCNRGLPTIRGISGRVGRLIELPDGRSIHSLTFSNIFKKAEVVSERSIKEFQIHFHPPRKFVFIIVPDKNFNDDVLAYIRRRLEDALGAECEFQFELVEEIFPSKNGKLEKFVVIKD